MFGGTAIHPEIGVGIILSTEPDDAGNVIFGYRSQDSFSGDGSAISPVQERDLTRIADDIEGSDLFGQRIAVTGIMEKDGYIVSTYPGEDDTVRVAVSHRVWEGVSIFSVDKDAYEFKDR